MHIRKNKYFTVKEVITMKEDYCTAKEDMANIIDSNFNIRMFGSDVI